MLAGAAAAETIKLRCATQGSLLVDAITVNYDEQTVNGFKATITDTEIKWSDTWVDPFTNHKYILDNTINRLNGAFISGGRPTDPQPTFPLKICEKAPAPKF
jgi:hypothetical protein